MKYSKKKLKLANYQKWYDNQSKDYQSSHKRPGSIKCL